MPQRLPEEARALIEQQDTEPTVSAASLWEIAIKNGLGRQDFMVDPHLLRRGLLENGYAELAITGAHAVAVNLLPPIHKDPFDRILVAQAQIGKPYAPDHRRDCFPLSRTDTGALTTKTASARSPATPGP